METYVMLGELRREANETGTMCPSWLEGSCGVIQVPSQQRELSNSPRCVRTRSLTTRAVEHTLRAIHISIELEKTLIKLYVWQPLGAIASDIRW